MILEGLLGAMSADTEQWKWKRHDLRIEYLLSEADSGKTGGLSEWRMCESGYEVDEDGEDDEEGE